jgi:hypothetical protein
MLASPNNFAQRNTSWEKERRAVAVREKEEWERVLALAVTENEESESVRWEILREGWREREAVWEEERGAMAKAVMEWGGSGGL